MLYLARKRELPRKFAHFVLFCPIIKKAFSLISCVFRIFFRTLAVNFLSDLKKTFHDDFMFLIEWRHFYTELRKFPDDVMTWIRYTIFIGWIFCIFRMPYEKTDRTNRQNAFLGQKQQKSNNCLKSTLFNAKIPWRRHFVICRQVNFKCQA